MRYSNLWPKPDFTPQSGMPLPLDRKHGTDYGKPVQETTVANVSRTPNRHVNVPDKGKRAPKGL